MFEVVVFVLLRLGPWPSCLVHRLDGKWHLSWFSCSEGVALARWRYWDVSRALGWLNLFCTSAAETLCTVIRPSWAGGTWAAVPPRWPRHRLSRLLHEGTEGPRLGGKSWFGQYLFDASYLSNPPGYQIVAQSLSLSLRWFVFWCYRS